MIEHAVRRFPNLRIPVVDGGFELVYEPDPEHPNTWMVNDHCLIQDEEGRIHYFGIENPFPATPEALEHLRPQLEPCDRPFLGTMHALIHGGLYGMPTHFRVGHAVAEHIRGPWTRLPAAHDGRKEKRGFGAPFVVRHEGLYWMFVSTTGSGIFTSSDLERWEVVEDATPWSDPDALSPTHRDPCILRLPDGRFLQYFAGRDPRQRHTVRLATSSDLKTWHGQEPCYAEEFDNAPTSFGLFESPFVTEVEGLYYLFVGFSHRHYYESFVLVSDDPFRFFPEHKITTVFSHAPELIEIDGRMYISSCGIEDPQCLNRSGLWIAGLNWLKP
ncbi:hypothetical protein ACFLSJ_05080 [Verrucomicrobiota bacterium]